MKGTTEADGRIATTAFVVVAGMPRGGTTYLYHVLQRHPEIFVPFRKELHYFFFNRHRGDDWYRRFFSEIGEGQVGFDISPAYFMDSRVIEHILAYDPSTKVILSVRDPVEWSLSLYSQISTFTFGMPPYEQFIERYDHKIAYTPFTFRLTDGLVTGKIREFREAFGDNLLIYDFALVKENPAAIMTAIERFAGVASHFNPGNVERTVINASGRRNFKPYYWLMSREPVANALGKVFPASLLRRVRGRIDAAASKDRPRSGPALHDAETRALAERAFASQRAEVAELFANARIMLGSGAPFP